MYHYANFIIFFQLHPYSSFLRSSLDWPGIHYVAQIGVILITILLFQSPKELLLRACTTLLTLPFLFLQWKRISPQLFGVGACLSWVQTFLHAHECWWFGQQPSQKSVPTQKPSTRLQLSSFVKPTLISFPSTVNDLYVTSHLCTSGVSVSIQVHRSLMTPREI